MADPDSLPVRSRSLTSWGSKKCIRSIKTEEKAKVRAAALRGTKLSQLLAALAILHQDDLKKGMNSSYSSYCSSAIHPIHQIVLVQNSWSGKEMHQFCPTSSSDDLCILFCTFILLLCCRIIIIKPNYTLMCSTQNN